ncbi:MAG: hypothetical protein PPP58_07915 [Natronomonas sp.]
MVGYYDVVLGLIPLSLVGLTAAFVLAGISSAVAVPFASLAAVGLMGHAMFVRGPTEESAVAGYGAPDGAAPHSAD